MSRQTLTDGSVYEFADGCVHCTMDTAGNHAFNCPLRLKRVYGINLENYHRYLEQEDKSE